jgi:Fe-S-cluster containining protein
MDDVELDLDLLRGFRFRCRPECGLCCYAEPRVEADERGALLQIAPQVELVPGRGASYLAARPEGGACQFLLRQRCSAWPARPRSCREFPVSVHVGDRLQASLVLSCPGLDLASLMDGLDRSRRSPPLGLDEELAAVRASITPDTGRRLAQARRRHRRLLGALRGSARAPDEAALRASLRERLPLPTDADFPVEEPPAVSEGLENLPLFFDGRPGPVALAEGLGGWELREVAEGGGAELLAVIPPPSRLPPVSEAGTRLLRGYLGYCLERDAVLAHALLGLEGTEAPDLLASVERELREIGALVLSRADVRRRISGASGGPLSAADVELGIRATDQEVMDRPTWGDRL